METEFPRSGMHSGGGEGFIYLHQVKETCFDSSQIRQLIDFLYTVFYL